jgi:hypothetical protein
LELIRESLHARLTDQRVHNAAYTKLNVATDALSASIRNVPSSPAGIVLLLSDLARQSEMMAGLAAEHVEGGTDAEGVEAEILIWTRALCASVRAHQHDIDFLMPWARFIGENVSGDEELISVLNKMVSLSDLPAHCDAALQLLMKRGEQSGADKNRDALVDALGKSVSAAHLVNHRLAALADHANTMFRSMEFGFLFDPDRQLL